MGLECGCHHSQKRWSREFEDFERETVGFEPLKLRSWDWTTEARVGFWPLKDVLVFFRSLPTEIFDITRYTARWGGVSIVWLAKTFKNWVSLLVSKNRIKKLKKPYVPETTEVVVVSLFNGISTLCRLFNAKATLLEEQSWYYLTHSWEDKGVNARKWT